MASTLAIELTDALGVVVTRMQIGPLLLDDLAAVEAAVIAQQDRRKRCDPRLPELARPELRCQLARLVKSSEPVVVARTTDEVVGLAVPDLQVYGSDSDMLTYWPSRKGESRDLVLSCPNEMVSEVADALLQTLDRFWVSCRATGAGLVWPARDIDLSVELACSGFKLDAQLAFRHMNDFLAGSGPQLQKLQTRHIIPSDTAAVVDIFMQVIDAHIPASPFARHTESAKPAFRTRLEAVLSHQYYPTEAEAFILVGELDHNVVAMADCWISSVSPTLTPILPSGRYGYINSFGVSSGLRRGGIGRKFEAAVHQEFSRRNVIGTYLWFSEYNASARNFWPSLGYKPIWTSYQRRTG
jgi:GNAT superfamily N-acetyltransferase